MAWDHLSINRPHLAYVIIGGFTSLFMLVSLFVKEKLYIGEATVATICGIIFGPYGANLFNPNEWGNVDQITLECSRIVLVVQCFAVGVELPKKYMSRHWRSVVWLLGPVMTFGWLICSLFIWWMIPPLSWLESLAISACVTATDPVLASSVVGKGKFAKRIPKHLRDLLSAESGCNDGMAFPFIFLSLYLIHYKPHTGEVISHFVLYTVLYECVFGTILGVTIGYAGRQAIKFAERRSLIDRESFLSFYFVLALFCAGAGSLLGADDLLVGFAAGVAFSNDGWFAQRTEESHVSNVIDLLLNLAYFVYFGSIIPWNQYNMPDMGITPWRLVVIAVFMIFFRRIPIMVALKPFIPDIKTWRESLFAGHFGPVGVGAIFVAIMARAELEGTDGVPLETLPGKEHPNYTVVVLIWPIVTFMVISSIIVHGSSIAVFTLGKHVNTMRLTMSFTIGNDDSTWFNRLPRIGSRTPSMSFRKADISSEKLDDQLPPGTLPPVGGFAGRLSRASTKGREDNGRISMDAPRRRRDGTGRPVNAALVQPQTAYTKPAEHRNEAFREGRNLIFEDEQGDVISQVKAPNGQDDPIGRPDVGQMEVGPLDVAAVSERLRQPRRSNRNSGTPDPSKHKPAMAFRFDDNIIVEDADGEVIKRYKIPKHKPGADAELEAGPSGSNKKPLRLWSWLAQRRHDEVSDDDKSDWGMITDDEGEEGSNKFGRKSIRLRDQRGRKLSKSQFFNELKSMDPHARKLGGNDGSPGSDSSDETAVASASDQNVAAVGPANPSAPRKASVAAAPAELSGSLRAVNSRNDEETAVERKRREAVLGLTVGDDSDISDDEGGARAGNMKVPGIKFADSVKKGFNGSEKEEGPTGNQVEEELKGKEKQG